MAFVDVKGERFNVQVDGAESSPVLMLSNSLGTNLSMWDAQVGEWAKDFRVVRYDSRGHGQSTAPDRPYSIAELGRDALGIMDALGVKKANWCGLSKGGMVGQWLLVNAPQRLERVVLANTSAHMAMPDVWNERIKAVRSGGMAALAEGIIERWFTKGFRDKKPNPAIDKVRSMILSTPPQGYAGCCSAIRDMDQREAIRGAKNPVLVIFGAHDPATTPEMARLLVTNIPGAKDKTLDAAHLSNIEQPQAFTAAVRDFLKG